MQISPNELKYTQVAQFSRELKSILESYLNMDGCVLFGQKRLSDEDLREVLRLMFSVESGNRGIAFRSGALSKTVYETCFKGNPARRALFEVLIDELYPELGKVIRTNPSDPRRK